MLNNFNREKILLPFIGVTSLFSSLFIGICVIINYKVGALIMTSNFVLFIGIYFLCYGKITNYKQSCHLYISNCTATVAMLSIFHSGGIYSPFLITYIMLTVIVVLLLGKSKGSWFWLGIFILIIIAIGISQYMGYSLPIKYDQSNSIFFFTMCLIGVPLCTFFISLIFEKENEANFKLLEENQALSISNDEKDVLIKEIHHRVKNNLQIISSLISLQTYDLHDKKTLEILNVTKSRIYTLSLIHQKLFTGNNVGTVNFKDHLNDLIESQKMIFHDMNSSVNGCTVDLDLDLATPLSLVASEVITNAFKHAFKDCENPRIDVSLSEISPENYELKINDNGIGLPKNFSFNNSKSLGMEIINSLTEQIDATVTYNSSSTGTECCIRFNSKIKG